MYSLWFIADWLSKVPETLVGSIFKGVKTLFFSLDTWIYRLIIDLYNIFIRLCTVRLLSTDLLRELSQRIGYILGVIMLFYVIIAFIQMLLNPDNVNDKEKGAASIIKKTIIVIVMLGTSNFVFNTLFQFQVAVVQSNIISKILLPFTITTTVNEKNDDSSNSTDDSSDNTDESENVNGSVMSDDKFGSLLSEELLMSFYQVEDLNSSTMEGESSSIYNSCVATVNAFRTQIVYYGRFDLGYVCLNEEATVEYSVDGSALSKPQEASIINFNWFLSPLCGLGVVYLIFMYCLKVGVRMVQLMFLEIISPMAIVSYLAPKKDTVFSKWSKIYTSTYVDVFIRIAIINFVFFLISVVFSNGDSTGLGLLFSDNDVFVKLVIILSLLTFAHKAPDLIKELIPAGASKLGFGPNTKDIVGLNKGVSKIAGVATGAVAGGVGAVAGGNAIGLLSGAFRGAAKGFSSKGLRSAASSGFSTAKGAAETTRARISHGGSRFVLPGTKARADAYDIEKEELESRNSTFREMTSHFDNTKKRAESKVLDGSFNSDADGLAAFTAYQKLEMAKQRAGNIKRTDFVSGSEGDSDFEDAKNRALADISTAQSDYHTKMDTAVEAFVNRGGDSVITSELTLAQGIIDANPNVNFGTNKIASFADLKTANTTSNTNITANTNKLATNKNRGDKARTNVKYANKKH